MKGDVLGGSALRMTDADNVATALADLDAGAEFEIEGDVVLLPEAVPFGHKFAVRPIDRGEEVSKYGEVIGRATDDVAAGEWVHTHNCESTRGRGDLAAADATDGEQA
ncbi:UxaA family hydrolase [Halorarum salinum]|uniref:UxaA family hydrolase n=1 Tax=Halorarum salinum TaxID=2743089 RepID=A0A7D5L956_9EURY|nr:UxaA family hydrolase [Halobaculum salinum]QLG61153.1 UxaA family hydrolase [Halobaculum salinum]